MKKVRYFSIILTFMLGACSNLVQSTVEPPSLPTSQIMETSTSQSVLSAQQGKLLIRTSAGYFITNPDGSSSSLVIPHSETIMNVALSHDHTRVAFLSEGILTIKNLETGETEALNQERVGGTPGGIGWSPDDQAIGFDCSPMTKPVFEICMVKLGDGRVQILTHVEQYTLHDQSPFGGGARFGNWSRDGTEIAFVTQFAIPGKGAAQGIVQLLNMASGQVMTVFDEKSQDRISIVTTAAISPDGRTVLFNGKLDGKGEIFQINTDGSGLRQVTRPDHPYDIGGPVWSPLGDRFFAYAAKVGDPKITGVPSLFSLDGNLITQLNIDGDVLSWIK